MKQPKYTFTIKQIKCNFLPISLSLSSSDSDPSPSSSHHSFFLLICSRIITQRRLVLLSTPATLINDSCFWITSSTRRSSSLRSWIRKCNIYCTLFALQWNIVKRRFFQSSAQSFTESFTVTVTHTAHTLFQLNLNTNTIVKLIHWYILPGSSSSVRNAGQWSIELQNLLLDWKSHRKVGKY